MARFSGKTVVITGTAAGIGRETAIRFAAEGAHVLGGDVNSAGGEETAELCRREGGAAHFLRTDVTSEDAIARLVSQAVEVTGKVDVLFNNAGSPGAVGPIEDIPANNWDKTFHILVRSMFFGIKHVVPHMKKQGRGAIISTASIAGQRGFPFGHAYCASKAGMINLTRSAAVELGPYGIRVNCVCPGDILTAMQGDISDIDTVDKQLAKRQPIARAGQPRDVAGAVLYLASDDAEWITGEALTIDGGATVGIWNYNADMGRADLRQSTFISAADQN